MKDSVINYFKTDRGFAAGKALYGTLPGKSIAFNNALNRMTDTPANVAKLHYELGKLAGLNERALGIMLRKPVEVVANVETKGVITLDSGGGSTDGNNDAFDYSKLNDVAFDVVLAHLQQQGVVLPVVPEFEGGFKGLSDRKKFAKDNSIEVSGGKTKDFDKAIYNAYQHEIHLIAKDYMKKEATKDFASADTETKKTVKLFDRFTFLTQEDCPQVFKTLVGELGATYRKYKEAHAHLFDSLTTEDRLEAAKDVVTPFKENKSIWTELEHYQTNGECLGKHALVSDYLRKETIKAMNGEQLAKLQHNLTTKINRNKSDLEKLEGSKAKNKTKLINTQEEELRFVEVELKSR